MTKFIFVLVASIAVVLARPQPEPPIDEPLEGPRHYPELLPRVRDLLIYDNPPGQQPQSQSSGAYGVPGGSGPGSFGGLGQAEPKQIILADPELAPLLSTFDLSPSVEKRTGMGQGPSNAGGFGQGVAPPSQRGFGGFGAPPQGRGAGGYN